LKQALLVIDAQQELIEGNEKEPGVFNKSGLIDNINLVIDKALENDVLIVFMRDLDVAGGEGDGFQVHQNIKVPPTAKIFDKKSTSSFHKTPLLAHLQDNEIEHVVIMGCATGYCIDTAVRVATMNGFDVTLVGDGHSTQDSSSLTAEQIINYHNEILHGHYNVDNFSMVRKANEDLFQPLHDNHR
jgi:nicotinamidase-related amidase